MTLKSHRPPPPPPPPPKTFQALPEVLPPSVIPFWKPLMTLYQNFNSVAEILQIFLQPYFAHPHSEDFQKSYPPSVIPFWKPLMTLNKSFSKVAEFFKFFATPPLMTLYKNRVFANFWQPHFVKPQ